MTIEAFMYLSLPIPPGTRQYTLQVGVVWVGVAMGRWAWHRVALFPGAEGEERERLVHTVCACT